MAITPDTLDYTSKDFSALNRELKALAISVFSDWDTDAAGFDTMMLALFARVGDKLTFYQDRQANESRWSTAKLRRNILSLLKLIGYQPAGATAVTATEQFTLSAAAAADVTLAAGSTVRTADVTAPVVCQLLADLVIPAGDTVGSATVENSVTRVDTQASTNLPDQRVRLSRAPYLDGSIAISAGNGTYTVVDNLLDSTGTDRHCTIALDQNDFATFMFGDGNLGAVPTGTITATYRTWGGFVGKLAASTLVRLDGSFSDANGNAVRITVTNAAASTQGSPRESIARIKILAPRSIRTQRAAVAREDFETGALGVVGVARALHLTSNEDAAVGENRGFLWLVTTDGSTASATLIDQVRARFYQVAGYAAPDLPALTTFQLSTLSAAYLDNDVQMTVFKRKGFTAAQVKANILAALAAFYAISVDEDGNPDEDGAPNPLIDFGYYLQDVDGEPTNALAWSDVFRAASGATGVQKVDPATFLINGVAADVALALAEFPRLGSVTIVDGDTGLEM